MKRNSRKFLFSKIENYRENFPDNFWQSFPSNRNVEPRSWIDPGSLKRLALELDYPRRRELDEIVEALEQGATLGVAPEGRTYWHGKNYGSAFDLGDLLSDTLAEWTSEKVVSGPWTASEASKIFPIKRVHPMSVEKKASGAGRIIIDMSAPRKPPLVSVNKAIDSERFSVTMATCASVLRMITSSGWSPSLRASKCDWRHA